MSALSKLVHRPPLFNQRLNHVHWDQLNTNLVRLLLLASGRNSALINIVRHGGGSHARIFARRQGQLINNRIKDVWHFYYIGLGLIPLLGLLMTSHIIFGSSCELMDYPKEGEKPPHYWQFERAPLRQFWAKTLPPDMSYHESWASRFSNYHVKNRWRRLEARVKHLIGERQDYKAYHYRPHSAEWIDLAKRRAARNQHYVMINAISTGREVR